MVPSDGSSYCRCATVCNRSVCHYHVTAPFCRKSVDDDACSVVIAQWSVDYGVCALQYYKCSAVL